MSILQHRTITVVFCCLYTTLLSAASSIDSELIEQEIARARSEPDSSTTIEIRQPIALVFDALLTRLAEYSEDIASLGFDNSAAANPDTVGIGSKRITTMADGKILVQRIVLFEPPLRFAYFTDMSLSTVSVPIDYSIGYYAFNERADGVVEASVSAAYRPSSRLTAFLVRIGFNRALAKDFERAEEYLNALGTQ